jgi:prolyl oligopeptidase
MPRYPDAPRRPVTETIGGITFDDPYRWLEDESDEARAWQAAQNALAEQTLRGWPGYTGLVDALTEGSQALQIFAPQQHGTRWFGLAQLDPDGMPALVVADAPSVPGRVLIDPNAPSREHPVSLDWHFPSPDGRYVAYGLSEGGNEQSVLHVLEVDSGRVLDERIPHTTFADVAWLPDASGFYYTYRPPAHASGIAGLANELRFHRIGDREDDERVPVDGRDGVLRPQVSDDGRYVAALGGHLEDRPDYLLDRAGDGAWRPFLRDAQDNYAGVFVGDEYVAVTTDGAPRGRLVAIPVASAADRATWRELVPESEAVLISVAHVAGRLVLGELVNATARVRTLDLNGRVTAELPLSGAGVVGTTSGTGARFGYPMVLENKEARSLTFVYQSLSAAPALYEYRLDDGTLSRLSEPAAEHPDWVQRQAFCTARDGARVSLFVVEREDIEPGSRPTIVHAYGGFNISLLPGYFDEMTPVIQAGGRFVLVNARGGGEFGREFWHAARFERKQATFDDVYAAAEWLIEQGLTTPAQLGLYGGSNGGLMAAVAANQRPELFGAVVALVPILDLMRLSDMPMGAIGFSEYGDNRNPEHARFLYAYSPYNNVREGQPYPAFLLLAGENDVRCPIGQCRKLVARVQAETATERPILMRIVEDMGHFTGMSLARRNATTAEWLGFLMRHIGLEP